MASRELFTEKIWVIMIITTLVGFTLILGFLAQAFSYTGPSAVCPVKYVELKEKIKPGVKQLSLGVYEVTVIGRQWAWTPNNITLENPRKIIFKVASEDVLHGFEIVGTNVNVMVIPGYVAVITWNPPENMEGTYIILCNEYCGIGHQSMYGTLTIVRG